MKSLILLLAMIIMVPFLAKAGDLPKVPVHIYNTYIPDGFDSNDQSEVFISGSLPSTCYKNPFSVIKQVGNNIEIEVMAYYDGNEDLKCAQMLVPFLEKVELGLLDKGNYNIVAKSGLNILKAKNLKVIESVSDSVDDYVYASVDYISENPHNRVVQLKGYNPSDCFQFDRVEMVSNKEDVYSILPIMKKVSDFCPMKMVPFSIEVEVPDDLPRKNILLHVRSMDGRSINHLFAKYRQ